MYQCKQEYLQQNWLLIAAISSMILIGCETAQSRCKKPKYGYIQAAPTASCPEGVMIYRTEEITGGKVV